jgi:hypothetical protein
MEVAEVERLIRLELDRIGDPELRSPDMVLHRRSSLLLDWDNFRASGAEAPSALHSPSVEVKTE